MGLTRVAVLGAGGMLGSMVVDYLSRVDGLRVNGYTRRTFEVQKFLDRPEDFKNFKDYDYLINCIGIIKPHCKDDDPEGVRNAITVNAWFPHRLAEFIAGSPTRIIQIATDCVYSGQQGNYTESDPHDPVDVYGKTKSLGEVFDRDNFLNIRCSIIGPEVKGKLSLYEWFLAQPEGSELTGFAHHRWNGVTTLQFARLTETVILQDLFEKLRRTHHTLHFTANSDVTKAELLHLFSDVFGKPHPITVRDDVGPAVDRTLRSEYHALNAMIPGQPMRQSLQELKRYLELHGERWRS